MPSFTSNFKMGGYFVLKCLLIMSVVMVAWLCLVSFLPTPSKGANQWQGNALKAQIYVLGDKHYRVVVLGSSMLYRVPVEKCADDCYNLAFAGGNTNTGLAVVEKTENLPEVLLVEVNETLTREVDRKLLEVTDTRVKFFPWRQYRNRPDVVLIGLGEMWKKSANAQKPLQEPDKPKELPLRLQRETHDKLLAGEELTKFQSHVDEMGAIIDRLMEKGVHVVLVVPPEDVSLFASPRNIQVRKILEERFPSITTRLY